MRVLITGGTGFIGTRLCQRLSESGHQLTVFSRRPESVRRLCGPHVEPLASLEALTADARFDAVINLAGESIAAQRWSEQRKQQLLDSRLDTTRSLVRVIETMEQRPRCLINASAVGYYGDQGNAEVDESTPPHDEFAHQLCKRWEEAARQAEQFDVRVCIARFGLVIGSKGGFVEKMRVPFKLGLGGPFGSGQQWMSWIHLDDLTRLIERLLSDDGARGVYNATAPHPVTNTCFSKTLGNVLHRPALLAMPAWAAKVLFGEMSQLLLTGQRVLPVRISAAGFEFEYPELKGALVNVLK